MSPPTAISPSRVFGGALFGYIVLLTYASLSPFLGWNSEQRLTLFDWPKYVLPFDVLINVVAYVPLGFLLAARKHRLAVLQHQAYSAWRVGWISSLIACALSVSFEFLQSYLPGRVASPLDVLTNTAGATLGALLVLIRPGRRAVKAAIYWRHRHFSSAPMVDWGLLLLAVWFVAQLNPAIPIFEAGFIVPLPEAIRFGQASPHGQVTGSMTAASEIGSSVTAAYDVWVLLPQSMGVALSVAAFALFVSVLAREARVSLLMTLLVMAIGFGAKLVMASLLLKAPQLASTLSPSTLFGALGGLMLCTLFLRVSRRWRCFWACLTMFAGGALVKVVSSYPSFESVLKLFNWPYGQLANFAGLTLWLNEVWPLLALILLAYMFVSQTWESHS
jgi:VanZ family protein